MQANNKLEYNVKKVLVEVATKAASLEANSACFFFAYQPKESQAVQERLQQFKNNGRNAFCVSTNLYFGG